MSMYAKLSFPLLHCDDQQLRFFVLVSTAIPASSSIHTVKT
jgi:hypothetical protein